MSFNGLAFLDDNNKTVPAAVPPLLRKLMAACEAVRAVGEELNELVGDRAVIASDRPDDPDDPVVTVIDRVALELAMLAWVCCGDYGDIQDGVRRAEALLRAAALMP